MILKRVCYFSVLIFLVIGFSFPGFAEKMPNPIGEKTKFVLNVNLGKLYDLGISKIEELKNPENSKDLEKLLGADQGNKQNGFSSNELVDQILEFENKKMFKPNGFLWLAVDSDFRFCLTIDAVCKPADLFSFLSSYLEKKISSKKVGEKQVQFKISVSENVVLDAVISEDGIKVGSRFENSPKSLKDWKSFVNKAEKPDAFLSFDADFEAYVNYKTGSSLKARRYACCANMRVLLGAIEMYNMDNVEMIKSNLDTDLLCSQKYLKSKMSCPCAGKYSIEGDITEDGYIKCSAHGTVENPVDAPMSKEHVFSDPAYLEIKKIRLFIDSNGVVLATYAKSKEVRAKIRSSFEEYLKFGKKLIDEYGKNVKQSSGEQETLNLFNSMLNRVKFGNSGSWFISQFKAESQEEVLKSLAAISGFAAAIAVPNFKKARFSARQKACFANQRVILGAIEMYNMDNKEMLKFIRDSDVRDGGILPEQKYLKSGIVNPEPGCFYSSIGDLTEMTGKITCKIHGSVDDY